MSTVYIVQEPVRLDEHNNPVPVMDFRKVLEYGDPVVCLPNGRVAFSPGPTIDALKEKLKNITDDDYLVSVGDPTAIFAAAMVAGYYNNGRVNCLKWDKVSKRYVVVKLDIHHHLKKGEL